jgi:hypothetical protein
MTQNAQKWMIAASVFAALVLASVQGLAQGVTLPVKVVNTTGQPVPTAAQGTTSVAGTVNVGNTPNVNVANTPSVSVTNTPTVSLASGASVNVVNPLDGQDNPTPLAVLEATQPYEDTCSFYFSGNYFGSCNFTAIPQGKQLIVQEFDAYGEVDAGNRPAYITLSGTVGGVYHYFPDTFMVSASGFDWLATHQETRLYVASGSTPNCTVGLPQNSNGVYTCNFSGFLVDVSQAGQGTTIRHQSQPPRLPAFRPAPGR